MGSPFLELFFRYGVKVQDQMKVKPQTSKKEEYVAKRRHPVVTNLVVFHQTEYLVLKCLIIVQSCSSEHHIQFVD